MNDLNDNLSDKQLRSFIENYTKERPLEADFQFCMFSAALNSLRRSFLLKPFPSELESLVEGKEDFTQLVAWEALLLSHAIQFPKTFKLKVLPVKETMREIELQIGRSRDSLHPDYIFGVNYISPTHQNNPRPAMLVGEIGENTVRNEDEQERIEREREGGRNGVFGQLKRKYGTRIACHGSPMENIYSIVNNGLQSHLNKTAVFGEGTYLSTDLAVCKEFAPSSLAWSHSSLAAKLACIVVCEVIDHPQLQKGTPQDAGVKIYESQVPYSYYIVENNDHVRVKYLLVFGTGTPPAQ
eukprot:Ihof_evm1s275 gene=Ihof_evmTU1s275